MKTATINEIKKEISFLESDQVQALCLRLAKFKKENKELLTYLLFEAHNEHDYLEQVKREVTAQFQELTHVNLYYVKKSLRKILRILNKQIRYSGIPTTEIELRIHFCRMVKESGIAIGKSQVLSNLYNQQLKKINQIIGKLDEDLQYDYHSAIENLTLN